MASILYFIPALKSGPLTYYLFLPAAMKLFAILIFRWRAVKGIQGRGGIRGVQRGLYGATVGLIGLIERGTVHRQPSSEV